MAVCHTLLKATPPEQRTDVKPTEREKKTAHIEQIEKLEKEMSQVQEKYQEAESNYGSDLLNLVVAKGYLTKLLANEAIKSYIGRHEPQNPDPPGAGGEHCQHGRSRATAAGRDRRSRPGGGCHRTLTP